MRYGKLKRLKVFFRKVSRVVHTPIFSFLYRIAYADTCMKCFEFPYVYSVPVMHDTTFLQMKSLIDYAVKNKKVLVIMLHSILNKNDIGYNDLNSFDVEKFERICALLAEYRDNGKCVIVPTISLIK